MKNILVMSPYIKLFNNIVEEKQIPNSIIIRYDMDESLIDDVIEEANYISLFNDSKTIIINNYNQSCDEKLIDYLKHSNDNVLLIIHMNNKLSEKYKHTSELRSLLEIIDYMTISSYSLNSMISNLFKKNNIIISNNQINKIINKCLENYDYIYNECSKLMINVIDNKITDDDINNYVSDYINDNVFKFKDLVINKNINDALIILDYLISKKEEIFPLITLIAKEYRLMLVAKNNYLSDDEIAKIFSTKSYPIKLAREKAYKYTYKELKNCLLALSDLDYNFKSGKIDIIVGLKQFLYGILGGSYE